MALKGGLECGIIPCHPRNTPRLGGDRTDVSRWAGGKYKPVCIIRMPERSVGLRRSEVGVILDAFHACCAFMLLIGVCEVMCENKQTPGVCEEWSACM